MTKGVPRPGEDEFDVMFREGWAVPGFFIVWVAIVRGWRALKRLAASLRG
jgi:hypothetical protein